MRPPKLMSDFLAHEPIKCKSSINHIPMHEGVKQIPGYGGYVPVIKFDKGHTYSDLTGKYMVNHRCTEIGHTPPEEKRWYIPQTRDPKGDMIKGRLQVQPGESFVGTNAHIMYNVDDIQENNTNNFYNASQAHRNKYKQRYNHGPAIKHFQTAVRGTSMFED